MSASYLVESFFHQVLHSGRTSNGVLGEGGSSERIYLHVIALTPAEIARLRPRQDDDGNKQHDRLAPPGTDEWWIATEGTKIWPKTVRPKLASRCRFEASVPAPEPLGDADLATLRKLGADLPE